MSGGGKKVTVGYWYKYLQAFALSLGKLDAVLEFRAGGRTAWRGLVAETDRIYVNAKNLWGGQKKEGGLQGYMDIQLGDADQQPNDYLTTHLGADQPSYRGKPLAVWRGGIWGAMNPYPKRAEFKVMRVLNGWDNDTPWYPEKAQILVGTALTVNVCFVLDGSGSMLELVSGSKTRWDVQVEEVSAAIEALSFMVGGGTIAVVIYGDPEGADLFYRPLQSHADISALKAFVADWPIDVPFGTYWDHGMAKAAEFFGIAGDAKPVVIFTSDGDPTSGHLSGAITARDSVPGLEVHGILIDHATTGSINQLDNTGGAAVVTSEGGQVSSAALAALNSIACYGMNAAHVLYDSVTARDMQGEPVALINDASFRAAADVLYEEGFGLCTEYSFEEDIEDFQQRILDVIGGSMTQSREDGQYYLDLIRPTTDIESLPVITSDDIQSLALEPTCITEQVNEVVVEWYDIANNVKKSTPPMQSRGAVHAAGQVVSETIKYPEVAVESLAFRLCARDVGARSTPLTKVTATTNRRSDLWRLRPGKKARLQAPEEGVADMIIVIGDIDYGTLKDGRIKIKGVQDVYSMPSTAYVVPETSQTPPLYTPPVAPVAQRLIEAPYVEVVASLSAADLAAFPDDAGAIMTMAAQPSAGLNYSVYTAVDGVELEDNGTGEWCPSALVVEAAGYMDESFTLSGATGLDQVEVGTWALWDDEICRVDAIDEDALTVTLGRGCADTVRWEHAAGSRIWFCGDWGATDGAQYLDGDTVNAKLLTRTTIDELALASAALLTVDMNQRWRRPYPPAGVQLNGQDYPEGLYGDVSISWETRDRVMQSDQLFDASAPSVTPEAGSTWLVECFLNNALDHTETVGASPVVWTPSADGAARVEITTLRDGLASWQKYVHEFTSGDTGTLWTPTQIASFLWMDASATATIDDTAGAVDNFYDLSGSGFVFTQATAGKRPTTGASTLNGLNVLDFSASELYSALPASAWSALHSGTPHQIYFVAQNGNGDPSTIGPILSTLGDTSTSRRGVSIWLDDRAGVSRNNGLVHLVGSGGGTSTQVVNVYTGNGAVPSGSPALVGIECNYAAAPSNRSSVRSAGGSEVKVNSAGSSAQSGDAYMTLHLGSLASIYQLTGKFAELIIVLGEPDTATREKIEGYLAHKWGLAADLPATHTHKAAWPAI